jgi:hypothetical protein
MKTKLLLLTLNTVTLFACNLVADPLGRAFTCRGRSYDSPAAASQEFGCPLAFMGSERWAIGARYDSAGATDAGVAHRFNASGDLLAALAHPTPAYCECFGYSMASGETGQVLVGTEWAHNGAIAARAVGGSRPHRWHGRSSLASRIIH